MVTGGVRPFELVTDYDEIVANVKQFHEDLNAGSYMVDKLPQFKEWFFFPDINAFGPSKYIGYKDMNAVFYNNGHRTEEQKRLGSRRLNGGASTRKMQKWFRKIGRGEPLFNELYSKLQAFFSSYNKSPNKGVQLYILQESSPTSIYHSVKEEKVAWSSAVQDNDVRFAFDILLEEIETTVDSLNKEGAAAFSKNSYEQAQMIASKAMKVTAFRDKVKELQNDWSSLYAEIFGTPIAKADQRTFSKKLQRGLRTPEDDYRLPILEALSAMGGSGHIKEVLNQVYKKMKGKLNEYDHQPLSSSPDTPRWYNSAQWCRAAMVQEGLLLPSASHGIWEISEAGLNEIKRRKMDI